MRRLIFLILLGALASPLRAAEPPLLALSMAEAKAEALRNHPAYAAAQLRAVLAKESLKETQAAYFPTATGYADAVDASSENTRVLAGGLNNPSVYDRVAGGVMVSQLITDFGRTRNLTSGSKSQARAAAAGAESSREQILLNVEVNYLATLQAQAVVNVAEETLSTRKLLVEQVSALAKNFLKSDLDVSFAEVSQEQAELLLQKSQGDADGAMASLGAALGRKDARSFILADDHQQIVAPPDLSTLVDLALKQRPDLVNLQFQRQAAIAAAAAEKDANYPTLAAVGVFGNAFAEDSHLANKYAAAGVQLTVPIFDGGADMARQHEAEIRASLTSEALREAEDNVVLDVRLALVAYQTAFQRFSTTKQLLKHASQAFELAKARYKVGSSSIVELSDSQLNKTSAAIAFANADFDTRLRAAILDYQTGALH
jgi:outer membrane protein